MTTTALRFDEADHSYWLGGRRVPGVTSILKPLQNFDRIDPEVLAAKANLGSRVHTATEFLDQDDLDEDSVEQDVAPYLEGWKAFRRDTGCAILAVERRVYHPGMGFAGTLDRVLAFRGAKWLVDIKTAFTTPLAAGPQTAAYLLALADPTVTHRAALRLRPDGTYRLDHLTDPNDLSVFVACLTLHRFKGANS